MIKKETECVSKPKSSSSTENWYANKKKELMQQYKDMHAKKGGFKPKKEKSDNNVARHIQKNELANKRISRELKAKKHS